MPVGYARPMPATRLAHPPHLRRGREHRGDRRARRCAVLERAAPDGHRILVVDDDSPDGTGEIADRLAAEHAGRRGPAPHGRARASGPRTSRASRTRWTRGAAVRPRDGLRLLARPRPTSRGCWPPPRTPTSCSARATSPAAASSTGGRCGGSSAAAARGTRGSCSGSQVRDLTGGFKCFRREVLEAIDLPTVRSRGYAFQVELTYRAVHGGFRVVEVPIVFRDRQRGHVEDDAGGSPSRRRCSCRSCASAAVAHPASRAARLSSARRRRAPMHGACTASDLVLVRGIAHTRETLDAWNDEPWPVARPLARRLAGDRDAAARRGLGRRGHLDARRDARSCSRACTPTRASTRSATSSSATGSCSRCTRWRASRASSPAARCRSRPSATAASGAGSTTRPARSRSRSSRAATIVLAR